jgi:hypothetical protein
MNTAARMLRLDPEARRQLEEEQQRHESAFNALNPYDRPAVTAEFDRHTDRVHEIMHAMRARRLPRWD